MDMSKIAGSVSLEDFVEDLLSGSRKKTLGDLWENLVDCNHCRYKETCHKLSDYYDETYGINLYCGQIVDILTGEVSPEDVKEVK